MQRTPVVQSRQSPQQSRPALGASRMHLFRAVDVPLRFWLVMVLLLAFAVRIVALDKADLWLDEAISAFIAAKPPQEIISYTTSQLFEHPPGYYMFLHFWMRVVGDEEFALRFLSVFGSMLAVALSVALARRWFRGHKETKASAALALVVALLMTFQPMAVHVGREVRMYAWMMPLALLTVHALDRAFLHNRWRDWGLFVVAISLSVTFHYMAAFFVVAYALFVALFWRRLPEGKARLAAILAVIGGLAAVWILSQTGPRETLLDVLAERLQEPQVMSSLMPVYTQWALGDRAWYIAAWPAALLALVAWLPVGVGIAGMTRGLPLSLSSGENLAGGGLRRRRDVLRGLIILLLMVPPLLRAMIHLLPNARHSAMMTGVFVLCAALGIFVIFRRSRSAGVLMLLALLGLGGSMLVQELRDLGRPFSEPSDYIQARAADSETIVYTHPFDWPQNAYYNRRRLPVQYIPKGLEPATDEEAGARAKEILTQSPSIWLVLAPSVLEPERTERAFNELAFPTEKVWFSGGRGVIHYFSAGEGLSLEEHPGGLIWDDRIRLVRWAAASRTVAAGDALRLQFEWQRVAAVTQQGLVVLTLVGPDGVIWAKRVAAPCNGLCPAPDWAEEPLTERQAFYVPADVPPGAYELRIAWVTTEGAPILGRATDASASIVAGPPEIDLLLAPVEVMEPTGADAVNAPLSRPLNSAAGLGLTLLGADFVTPSLRAGQALVVPTQWLVTAYQPALDVRLDLKRPERHAQIVQSLGPAWYPAQAWRPGRTIRVQSSFVMPGDLPIGEYNATLSVIEVTTGLVRGEAALGTVQIIERPHVFEVPEAGTALDIRWGDGIRLARVLAPERMIVGQSLQMKLVWQAEGPTERNWKVFIHLVDADGVVRAQGDAYPLKGEALTTTWQRGEVIADIHTIGLPADMSAGSYTVQLGFYDEPTGERLPLADGRDALILSGQLQVDTP